MPRRRVDQLLQEYLPFHDEQSLLGGHPLNLRRLLYYLEDLNISREKFSVTECFFSGKIIHQSSGQLQVIITYFFLVIY